MTEEGALAKRTRFTTRKNPDRRSAGERALALRRRAPGGLPAGRIHVLDLLDVLGRRQPVEACLEAEVLGDLAGPEIAVVKGRMPQRRVGLLMTDMGHQLGVLLFAEGDAEAIGD